VGCSVSNTPQQEVIRWETLTEIPAPAGLSGAYAGVSNGTLIVAGGVKFTADPLGDSGGQIWGDAIYVLPKTSSENEAWITGYRLPRPLAYGASVSTGDSLIIIGGRDAERSYKDVFRLRWNSTDRKIEQETLPSLPGPVAYTAADIIGDTLYLVGGQDLENPFEVLTNFWTLNLKDLEAGWKELEPWPGPARKNAIAVRQSISRDNYFYLIGGEAPRLGDNGEVERNQFRDGYRYSPFSNQWVPIMAAPQPIAAAPHIAFGQSHLIVFGGSFENQLDSVYSKDLLVYHTITDTWIKEGKMPQGVLMTNAVSWNDGIVIPNGEISPGKSTAAIQYMVHEAGANADFGYVNYAFLGLYMIALVYMGFYFVKREKKTEDYFLAGHRIPWWAAGFSIVATIFSGDTFFSQPALVYSMDWFMYPQKLCYVLIPIFIIYFYLPFFRRLNLTTAYEYLEYRFNFIVRLYGSAQFILYQLVRTSLVLYLPSIALSTITGLNIYVCILSMGVLSTFYTVLGGIEAVIWTDVIQAIVLVLGAVITLITIPFYIDGGISGLFKTSIADDKFRMLYLDGDFSDMRNTWVILIGSTFGALVHYSSDQAIVQRYLTTPDEKSAAKSLWMNAIVMIPITFILYAVGTALYVYYKSNPAALDLGMQNDAIYPLFITQKIPIGLAGLVIAAIFAVSMSTLDSGMNSIATAVVTDFYQRLFPSITETRSLNLARFVTLAVGVFATIVAIMFATMDIKSVTLLFVSTLGLIGSGLGGLFALGIFTRRSNGPGALVGAIGSAIILLLIKTYTAVNIFLYSAIGFMLCLCLGYIASLLIPVKSKSLDRLTIFSLNRK
jgi:SSS family solute:Na+ symporter